MLDSYTGCIVGMAVGDSLGLPREGLSRQRQSKLFGEKALSQRFLFGAGMISDDTEHACMTAQALIASGGDPDLFVRSLSWRLRCWLLGMPAGVGLATLKSILKLMLGWSPSRSGVFSAGNGPAMRAPVIGVYANDDRQLRALVHASTIMTHTDPRAEQGALLIAAAARYSREHGPATDSQAALEMLRSYCSDLELLSAIDLIEASLGNNISPEQFAQALGLEEGVTGYISHTVPVALYCWLRFPGDYRKAVAAVIGLGGDTDTTGAIVGGLTGAVLGVEAIPQEWREGVVEFPRSVGWMKRLGEKLGFSARHPGQRGKGVPLTWLLLIPRNLLFMIVILYHGLRRLGPPY